MSGQIFNVEEASHPSEFQTTAAQAQAEAKTSTIAREVEANAEQAKDVAENAAFVAQSKGPELTGQSATDRLTTEAAVKTGAAVDQGQQDVAAAKAAGAGYVEQAKNLASNAVATAQSYIPPGSGPDGAHTAGDVVSGLQAGASVAYETGKSILTTASETAGPYIASAAEAAKPHLVNAKDVAASYLPGPTRINPIVALFPPLYLSPFNQLSLSWKTSSVSHNSSWLANNDQHAARQAAEENPEDEEHYQRATQHVANHPEEHRPLSDDEAEDAKRAHQKIYQQNNKEDLESHGADAVGGAVVTEVMQKVMASGGNLDMNTLLPLVMKEASGLLNSSGGGGGVSSGFKGEVMQKVAMMAFKSQLSGGSGGGMMTILQKFM
ncbi:hypothetical protein MVEN_01524500 [Mycena venus]|uniref:Uncharacterized protein n=1 Tax=Mycena venus TaxID=2733690 RepID=A0A8H6XWG0_9AGAR|nr:hypothetical protein MVEN_01524500 [Mycena venus]